MRQLLTHLRTRLATRTLAATTFCDECSEVCTASCRHDAVRERTYRKAVELNLYRH